MEHQSPAHTALLLDYAVGALDPAATLLVRTYVAMSDARIGAVRVWRAAANLAAEREAVGATPMRAGALDAVLDRLEDEPPPHPAAPRSFDPKALPREGWRSFIPGFATYDLPLPPQQQPGTRLRLFRLAPGFTVPTHAHGGGGEEVTLVLKGSFADEAGEYGAGDLLVLDDDGAAHTPRACRGQGCTCLTLTRGPFVFKGLAARILGALL